MWRRFILAVLILLFLSYFIFLMKGLQDDSFSYLTRRRQYSINCDILRSYIAASIQYPFLKHCSYCTSQQLDLIYDKFQRNPWNNISLINEQNSLFFLDHIIRTCEMGKEERPDVLVYVNDDVDEYFSNTLLNALHYTKPSKSLRLQIYSHNGDNTSRYTLSDSLIQIQSNNTDEFIRALSSETFASDQNGVISDIRNANTIILFGWDQNIYNNLRTVMSSSQNRIIANHSIDPMHSELFLRICLASMNEEYFIKSLLQYPPVEDQASKSPPQVFLQLDSVQQLNLLINSHSDDLNALLLNNARLNLVPSSSNWGKHVDTTSINQGLKHRISSIEDRIQSYEMIGELRMHDFSIVCSFKEALESLKIGKPFFPILDILSTEQQRSVRRVLSWTTPSFYNHIQNNGTENSIYWYLDNLELIQEETLRSLRLFSFRNQQSLKSLLRGDKSRDLTQRERMAIRRFSGHVDSQLPPPEKEQFTAVMLGCSPERISNIKRRIKQVASHPLCHKMLVLWNCKQHWDQVKKKLKVPQTRAPVHILLQEHNSFLNRFRPDLPIETEAVLIMDDDIKTSTENIVFLFKTWQKRRDALVGISSRRFNKKSHWKYRVINGGNLVLPRVMLVSFEYFHIYFSDIFKPLRQIVDRQAAHCDDIAFNFVAARLSRDVKHGNVQAGFKTSNTKGHTHGIGFQSHRKKLRTECSLAIRDFFNGWVPPHVQVAKRE
eukprot:gb/GECH01008126.1/.p1 GENE.gb/GECH01008126.1/~~gb/GECH01008126.1/.p1  ORF type:complete len:719 (+),score=79.36 gb/GECH01008126.1/:1-2157(+)